MSITGAVNIPIGDIQAEVEISIDYEIQAAVDNWLENKYQDDENVSEGVETLLNEYCRQQQSGRSSCQIGSAFEQAVEYASLKALKNLLRQV